MRKVDPYFVGVGMAGILKLILSKTQDKPFFTKSLILLHKSLNE